MLQSIVTAAVGIGAVATDDPQEKSRKQLLNGLAILMSMGGILWGILASVYGFYYLSVIPFGYTVMSAVNLTYFHFSKNFKVVRFIQVLMSLLLPFFFQWGIGGFVASGGVMLWALLSLTGSIAFQDRNHSRRWLIAYTVLIIFTGVTDQYWAERGLSFPSEVTSLFFTINVSVICAMVLSLVLYFVSLRDKANDELQELTENLEDKVTQRTQEISAANDALSMQKQELELALDNLKATQSQLVQSEKMASLGTLIAGIAHEINTPLGAISASIKNISESLTLTGNNFPELANILSEEDLKLFFSIVRKADAQSQALSSREERQIKRRLRSELENEGIENEDSLADTLVDAKVYDLEEVLPLLKQKNAAMILENLYHFSTLINDSKNISLAVSKASKVVFALKSFAHKDLGGEKQTANVVDNVETVLTLYHNQLKQGIEVVRNYEEVPMIGCFVDELNQVWTNLLHNALQAMNHSGEITINIKNSTILSESGEELPAVSVGMADNGPGIPEEIQNRIFEAFFTTKKQGEGTGLGLDIVSKIVKKHDGKIDVDSKLGEGTEFIITLPLA
ncbi:sensor histidine kinase [Sediminitomix flava]|uniref:histidine kinase n=1 Tax=Sediminitomix flava TaxID=379075 RepID=A0A316A381_SEDFL|nr:ATP-binding protein [Sediminitomix flava]PWJ44167.1 phospho-acceptor domain-containing protein [Sediminitomix flava]